MANTGREYKKLNLSDILDSHNIAPLLDAEHLTEIGSECLQGYVADKRTRAEWDERNARAIKLALQVFESKSFPWENCANIKFPLITIAALQFLARVSILTKGRNIVKCDVVGADPEGKANLVAKRIQTHMSYQLTEEDTNWINADEKVKFAASLMGCAFKKTYFDDVTGCVVSEQVHAADFYVDYKTKSLESAGRKTQWIAFTENDLQERVRLGLFLPLEAQGEEKPRTDEEAVTNLLKQASDLQQGITQQGSPIPTYSILEQHTCLDLDGDGYKEPYIVYLHETTGQVLRIVANFFDQGDVFRVKDSLVRSAKQMAEQASEEGAKQVMLARAKELQESKDNHIVRIVPTAYFTKYTFIPSPDGGFYDLGFGALLGPINESANTIINQMVDSGTMQTTAGGFLGRGVKMKGGQTAFNPFEWKPVDSTGDDLRKSIFPLPVREPSPVLFQLLGTLIQYGEKISGATDIMSGVSPGQNTPAETSRNTIEQGMKIFSGIYARMHRSFQDELRIIYRLNQIYLKGSVNWERLTSGLAPLIAPTDYDYQQFRVYPAADPATVSETQRQQRAAMVLQDAMQAPGAYNMYLVRKEYLEAFNVVGIEQLLPDPQGPSALPPLPNPKIELEKAKLQQAAQESQQQMQLALAELQQQDAITHAKVMELQAKAAKLNAEAAGVDSGHQIALINAQIAAEKEAHHGRLKTIETLSKLMETHRKVLEEQNAAKESTPTKKEEVKS